MLGHEIIGREQETSGFELGLVHTNAIGFFWEETLQILQDHPPGKGLELFASHDDIRDALIGGSCFLWVGLQNSLIELVVLCAFRDYPATRTLEVIYVGGKGLRRAFRHWKKIEDWARKNGATHVEARISRGMERFYKPMGVRETALYYRRPLISFSQ